MPEITNLKVRQLANVPSGYRGLGRCIHETQKAYLFEYYGHELFISRKLVVKVDGSYWAPAWAIERAKEYNAKRRVR